MSSFLREEMLSNMPSGTLSPTYFFSPTVRKGTAPAEFNLDALMDLKRGAGFVVVTEKCCLLLKRASECLCLLTRNLYDFFAAFKMSLEAATLVLVFIACLKSL